MKRRGGVPELQSYCRAPKAVQLVLRRVGCVVWLCCVQSILLGAAPCRPVCTEIHLDRGEMAGAWQGPTLTPYGLV